MRTSCSEWESIGLYGDNTCYLDRTMKITNDLSAGIRQLMKNFYETVWNFIIMATELMIRIFRGKADTENRLLLPEGRINLPDNREEKDFYAVPVRICRKSM